MLYARLKLVDTAIDIRRKILPKIADEINTRFNRSGGRQRVQNTVRDLVRNALMVSPTVQELLTPGSPLHAGLGLTDMQGTRYSLPTDRIESIVETVVGSIRVVVHRFRATNYNIYGSVEVVGIPEDHRDLLDLPAALQVNTNYKGNFVDVGEPEYIEWLQWLLESGGQVVVSGFYAWPVNEKTAKYSRTGFAIMRPGGTYSVPDEHVGSIGRNFITRAVHPIVRTDIPRLLRSMF